MNMLTHKKYRFMGIQLLVIACLLASATSAMGAACFGHPVVWSPPGFTLPTAYVGVPYSQQVTVFCIVGGCSPFGAYIVLPALPLPGGLNMSATGLISGTPLPGSAGPYPSLTVQATENCSPPPGGQNFAALFAMTVSAVSITGSASISSYSVPNNITTTQGITYTFTATSALSTTMTSTQGTFNVGGTQIGTNPSQISASLFSGRGSVSEAITVLPSVIQQALARGSSSMTYNRTFTNGTNTVNTQVTISITSPAGANLLITRMQLYFQNRMPVITVKRNDPTLKAYVDINYVGSGFLQGYWEVDGSLLTNVKQMITTGTTVTIESPSPPLLSTFIPGDHQIRFVVTAPFQNISFPLISYYVTPEETTARILASLNILSPNDQGVIGYEPTTFSWNASEGISIYFLEFFLKGDDKPIFSAYAKKPTYKLADSVLKAFFSPGKTYAWKVKGFDSSNTALAESPLFAFSIRE